MQKYSNLELNGFLTMLMGGWDEFAASVIVNQFHILPLASDIVKTKTKTKNDASVRGYTEEAGDVAINNKEIKKTVIGESESQVARVGYYKVKHSRYDDISVITWHHYWASDATTQGYDKLPEPIFGIEYEEDKLEPLALIRWDWRENSRQPPFFESMWVFMINLFLGARIEYRYISHIATPVVVYRKSNSKADR